VGGASGAGFAGGTGTGVYPAGGGGGAGGVGTDINGGIGINSDITGLPAIMYGSGGAGRNNGGSGTAFSGGATGTAGPIANRGGGGSDKSPGWYGGANGVVIIRYSDSFPAATSTTGSPTITVTGGYRIYRWTSSGSITI
jgi:hypothetical protein